MEKDINRKIQTDIELPPPGGEDGSSFGYYDEESRELVITDPRTPTKWINYIGTLDLGGFVDQTGGLNICKGDPSNNRITNYNHLLPQNEMRGNTLYLRKKEKEGTYKVFSPFFTPTEDPYQKYECRMGLGYNRYISEIHGIETEVMVFVPEGSNQVVQDIRVKNVSGEDGVEVDVIPVVEFSHPDALKNIINADWVPQTMIGKMDGDVLTQYPHMYEGKKANYLTANKTPSSFTSERNHFLGQYGYGTAADPLALHNDELDNYEAPRADNGNSMAAMMYHLGPINNGEISQLITQLGQDTSVETARESIERYRNSENVANAFQELNSDWENYLSHLHVETPDKGFNRIVNILGPRQNHATFYWSRYLSLNQLGYGSDRGIGVRDTNQDLMGVLPRMPEKAREMIEKLLSVQQYDGSSMHQFNPMTMEGSEGEADNKPGRDYYSDDHLWNVLSVTEYVKESGDRNFLDKVIAYYDKNGEERSGTVLEHLHRALAFTRSNTGRHDLPLLGWADWNDTVNLPEGAESVFTACLYGKALLEMQDLMRFIGDVKSADGYAEDYDEMKKSVNDHAWDGKWYMSYIDKDGNPMGSDKNDKGKIYLYPQAWAVMSGFATPDRARQAMNSVTEKLNTKNGIKISTPGYEKWRGGGGVSTYPKGAKENAGIFLHPNPWAMIAETMLDNGDRALEIFDQINPLNKDIKQYECQPDVFPQNVIGDEHPQFGLARNPWLSGTVSWINQATTKHILGIQPTYEGLKIDPVIPDDWPGYSAERKFQGVNYKILVTKNGTGRSSIQVDGETIDGNVVPQDLVEGKKEVTVLVDLGERSIPRIEALTTENEKHRKAAFEQTDSEGLRREDLHTLMGPEISNIYLRNTMRVHPQGLSETLEFPPTGVDAGAPTLSFGISPFGSINHLMDSGRSIRFGKRFGRASVPTIHVTDSNGDHETRMLTVLKSGDEDDAGEQPQIYPPAVAEHDTSLTLAPNAMISRFVVNGVRVERTTISPELAERTEDVTTPAVADIYRLNNPLDKELTVTLVLSQPSLVNLHESKLRAEQDNAFKGEGAVKNQIHREFESDNMKGVIMGSSETKDRMIISVPKKDRVWIDVQPSFRLAASTSDLLVNRKGEFANHYKPDAGYECGAAVSVTVDIPAGETVTIPFLTCLDFPEQRYVDGESLPRAYLKRFQNEQTRTADMAEWAMNDYQNWLDRTEAVHKGIFQIIRKDPSYENDRKGALRLSNLLNNELSYLLSNAAVWTEDNTAEFLECFDYPFLNSADVDWYSMLLLMTFPDVEKGICQKFIDSIDDEDQTEVWFHHHASKGELKEQYNEWKERKEKLARGETLNGKESERLSYLDYNASIGEGKKGYADRSLTHIRAAKKVKGSVSHDLGRLTAGNPLRGNVSEYDWFNTNYWVDLFPKLALRVLRDVKYTEDPAFLTKNWDTLKRGYDFWMELDKDGDGIPEGNPGEVKNTFDNIELFGYDSYSANLTLAGCKAMMRMAEMQGDNEVKQRYEKQFKKASESVEDLWVTAKDKTGADMGYYATCYDQNSGASKQYNTDVWTNQLDGLWSWISIGEDPDELVPAERAKHILRTIYGNNRVTNGWATQRTQEGEEVKSDQGKDVWIASNYVLAQMLDYYRMTEESKEVYKVMEEIILRHDNTSATPESVRPDENKFIVKGYPRPGAVWTQLVMFHLKEQRKNGIKTLPAKDLKDFMEGIFHPQTISGESVKKDLREEQEQNIWDRSSGRVIYKLKRDRGETKAVSKARPGTGGSVHGSNIA